MRLVYMRLEVFDQALQNFEIAKLDTSLQWVSFVTNLTYGDSFHGQASNAISNSDWEAAKAYQETALQFFENVINTLLDGSETLTSSNKFGIVTREIYLKAQARWAAAKFQRYYLAEGYYKQAVTIQKSNPEEGKRLKENALAELRVCAELGLSRDLIEPSAYLVRMLSTESETEREMKMLSVPYN